MDKAAFDEAVKRSKELSSKPDNNTLLLLYSYFKQATEGDVTGSRPGGFDFKGNAKWDAWAKIKGMSTDDAGANYIALVNDLHAKG